MKKINIVEVLKYLDDLGDEMFSWDRRAPWRNVFGGYPVRMRQTVSRMENKGWMKNNKITDAGRKQLMIKLLGQMQPRKGNWDGKWRIVVFDIDIKQQRKRDRLRKMLRQLGFYEVQRSVYISPYDQKEEIGYIREALGLSGEILVGLLEEIENEAELKKVFQLG